MCKKLTAAILFLAIVMPYNVRAQNTANVTVDNLISQANILIIAAGPIVKNGGSLSTLPSQLQFIEAPKGLAPAFQSMAALNLISKDRVELVGLTSESDGKENEMLSGILDALTSTLGNVPTTNYYVTAKNDIASDNNLYLATKNNVQLIVAQGGANILYVIPVGITKDVCSAFLEKTELTGYQIPIGYKVKSIGYMQGANFYFPENIGYDSETAAQICSGVNDKIAVVLKYDDLGAIPYSSVMPKEPEPVKKTEAAKSPATSVAQQPAAPAETAQTSGVAEKPAETTGTSDANSTRTNRRSTIAEPAAATCEGKYEISRYPKAQVCNDALTREKDSKCWDELCEAYTTCEKYTNTGCSSITTGHLCHTACVNKQKTDCEQRYSGTAAKVCNKEIKITDECWPILGCAKCEEYEKKGYCKGADIDKEHTCYDACHPSLAIPPTITPAIPALTSTLAPTTPAIETKPETKGTIDSINCDDSRLTTKDKIDKIDWPTAKAILAAKIQNCRADNFKTNPAEASKEVKKIFNSCIFGINKNNDKTKEITTCNYECRMKKYGDTTDKKACREVRTKCVIANTCF